MTTPIPAPCGHKHPIAVEPFVPAPKPESKPRPWFEAATWNVLYSTPVVELEPTFALMRKDGVSIILNQEAGGADITGMYESAGWRTHVVDSEYRVSWDPKVWEVVSQARGEQLTSKVYFRKGKTKPIVMRAARVVLRHRPTGRTLDALSYHLPSAVQARGIPSKVVRRVAALKDSMLTLGRLAKNSPADAVLFGGDDNVDERKGKGWGFMLRKATGLQQVTAPAPTHGNRKIDDFRVRGLLVGNGRVLETAGDHKAHLRHLRFI